eukprot:gene15637-21746_t
MNCKLAFGSSLQSAKVHSARASRAVCAKSPVRVKASASKDRSCSTADAVNSRRSLLAAAVLALAVQPVSALAAGVNELTQVAETQLPETVYFGNGCFWGRQKAFVDTEKALGRVNPDEISSVVGYAGGTQAGPGNKVCYYYGDKDVNLTKTDADKAKQEFKSFAEAYFKQFRKTGFGMMRLDPQDAGPGYRNVVGIPGGMNSPLFQVLKDANVNGMNLLEGSGNTFANGRPTEDDVFNTVWVVDSNALPFYRAEKYHQFHNGVGEPFPKEYTQQLKDQIAATGRIDATGCVEVRGF